jgi:hypothetical protein
MAVVVVEAVVLDQRVAVDSVEVATAVSMEVLLVLQTGEAEVVARGTHTMAMPMAVLVTGVIVSR